jgi:hypothetical protein
MAKRRKFTPKSKAQVVLEQLRADLLSWLGLFVLVFVVGLAVMAFSWFGWVGPIWLYHKANRD